MARFSDIPVELLLHVVRLLGTWTDLTAVLAVNRYTKKVVQPFILDQLANTDLLSVYLSWLIDNQHADAVQAVLDFGADPNETLSQLKTRLILDEAFTSSSSPSPVITLHYRRAGGLEASLKEPGHCREKDDPGEDDLGEVSNGVAAPGKSGLSRPWRLLEYLSFYRGADFSPLHLAAQRGNVEIVANLLGRGADVESLFLDTLGSAAMAMRILFPGLQQGQNTADQTRPYVYFTPLYMAAISANISAAKCLLASGASAKRCIVPKHNLLVSGWMVPTTIIHLAAFVGSSELVKYVVDNRYDSGINSNDESGLSPLAYATVSGNLSTVGPYLLQKGANPNVTTSLKCSLLLETCWHGRFGDALLLLDYGVELGKSQDLIVPALHACCRTNNGPLRMSSKWQSDIPTSSDRHLRAQVVKRLVESGADVNEQVQFPGLGPDTTTPVLLAAESGLVDVVAELIAAGANVSVPNAMHRNALLAAMGGHQDLQSKYDTISYLLEQGCDVNERTAWGGTPLHILGTMSTRNSHSYCDHCEEMIGRELITRGTDIHARTTQSQPITVFQVFCKLGSYTLCKVLADLGAANSLKPQEFKTIFRKLVQSRSVHRRDTEAIKMLDLLLSLDRTQSILKDADCFDFAVFSGDTIIAQMLLERNCSLESNGTQNYHFVSRACLIGAVGVVALLLDRGEDANEPRSLDLQGKTRFQTPLECAIRYSHDLTGYLLEHRQKSFQLVKLLLDRGAFLGGHDLVRAVVMQCIGSDLWEILDMLLERCDVGIHSESDISEYLAALCDSKERRCQPELLQVFFKHFLRPPRTVKVVNANFRNRYNQTPISWLLCRYEPLHFCPYEDCNCGERLLDCIVVLMSGGQLSYARSQAAEVDEFLTQWCDDLKGAVRDATLQMGGRVTGTSPGGRGRSTRHCIEFLMDRLGLSSADIRNVSTRAMFLNTVL
ncbi:hypothetical protein JX266_010726 [Neoarthrinium moseri]|nr:hypothetical protein JX266_010726 [Neoarthrinium moseri]